MPRQTKAIASLVLTLSVISACQAEAGRTEARPADAQTATPAATTTLPPAWAPGLSDVPAEARRSSRGGAPRPAAYWQLWNGCAPGNRSAEAAANGGRAAGFFLVDDLLLDPGVGLGDHVVASCEEALAIMAPGAAGRPTDELAAQLLVAELNLDVGAETCPAAEESAVGGQVVLAGAGYRGPSGPAGVLHGDAAQAAQRLITYLSYYNAGVLCE